MSEPAGPEANDMAWTKEEERAECDDLQRRVDHHKSLRPAIEAYEAYLRAHPTQVIGFGLPKPEGGSLELPEAVLAKCGMAVANYLRNLLRQDAKWIIDAENAIRLSRLSIRNRGEL